MQSNERVNERRVAFLSTSLILLVQYLVTIIGLISPNLETAVVQLTILHIVEIFILYVIFYRCMDEESKNKRPKLPIPPADQQDPSTHLHDRPSVCNSRRGSFPLVPVRLP